MTYPINNRRHAPCRWMISIVPALLASTIVPDAGAMEMKVCGDQVILSGRIEGNEYRRLVDLFDANSQIKVAVLRNSPGGDANTGYRVGQLFRERHIATYVSGYCQSSCSRFFLGGEQRFFTNDYPANKTRVGFHSNYRDDGSIVSGAQSKLKKFLADYSDGKIDQALADRWVNLNNRKGFAYFFNAEAMHRSDGVSVLLCQGTEPSNERWALCEKIPGHDAVSMGIATSFELKRSCDADTLHERGATRSSATGSANGAPEDETALMTK